MDIEYKGANCVVLTTRKSKLVLDPKLSIVGLKDVSTKSAIELATEERFATKMDDAELNIEGPGEYEVGDFSIKGVAARRHIDAPDQGRHTTLYRVEAQDLRIAILGNIAPKLDEEQLEALGVVDLVILPVGGNGYTLDGTSAASIVRSIDAKVVIPVHYSDPALKYEVQQDDLSLFMKEFKAEHEVTSKYKIKAVSALPQVPTIVEITRS